MKLAFHGDKVKVRILNRQLDAEIVQVIESVKTLVGRLHINKDECYVVVDDKRIKHQVDIVELLEGCLDNQVVVVEILSSPTLDKNATAKVISIIGNYLDEVVEVDSAIHRHQITFDFRNCDFSNQSRL